MFIDTAGPERPEKELKNVFALNAGVWPENREDPSEIRDRYHRIAMHEAQIADEALDHHLDRTTGRSLIERVRISIGLAPTEQPCVSCPA